MDKRTSELKKEVHRLVSIYVRKRDGCCVICGKKDNLEAGHLFKRAKLQVTFDLRNVNTQCSYHNTLHNTNIAPYKSWFIRKYGLTAYNELERESKRIRRWSRDELTGLILIMQDLIKGLT